MLIAVWIRYPYGDGLVFQLTHLPCAWECSKWLFQRRCIVN